MFVEAFFRPKNRTITLDELRRVTPRVRRLIREAHPELDAETPRFVRGLIRAARIFDYIFYLLLAVVLDALILMFPAWLLGL